MSPQCSVKVNGAWILPTNTDSVKSLAMTGKSNVGRWGSQTGKKKCLLDGC